MKPLVEKIRFDALTLIVLGVGKSESVEEYFLNQIAALDDLPVIMTIYATTYSDICKFRLLQAIKAINVQTRLLF